MTRVGSILCPVMVGRDDLLELADHLIAEAADGRGHTLFLSGQAGLGKTRLIRATVRKATAAGLRVDGGSVAPQDREVPLASIREMATGMRGNPAFDSLGRDLLAMEGARAGDAVRSRRLLVRGAAERILAAIEQPTMLVFDDLHWTDELSLEVIAELARHGTERPLFLLAGYRADEFPADTIHREWRARILSQRDAREARLLPLSIEQTAVATTLILGGELPAPREVVEAVQKRTNGIPLHIEELLGALDDDARSDGRRILEAHVPDTIGDAVLARFGRLSAEAQLVARAGAVVGRCFSPDVIAGMVDRPLIELETTIEELVDASILYPFDYVDKGYYDFRHQLLRDSVYGTLTPAMLRRFHAQAAEFGMTLEAANVIHASRHYESAGLRAQAFRAALSGARAAAKVFSHREAFELYERAVRNIPPELDAAEHAEILEAFSEEAGANDENEIAERIAGDALERFRAADRPLDMARVRGSLVWFARRLGRPVRDRIAMVEEGLAELARTPSSATGEAIRVFLLVALARMHLDARAVETARKIALEAEIAATAIGDREMACAAQAVVGATAALTGDIETGLAEMGAAAREARSHQFAGALGSYRDTAAMAARLMDYRQSEAWVHEGIAYAAAIDQWHCRYNMSATLSMVDWADARWDQAIAVAGQVIADRRGGVAAETTAQAALGYVALGRGDLTRARALLERSLAAGTPSGEVTKMLPALWGLAEVGLADGDTAAAIGSCEAALDMGIQSGERALIAPFLVTGARACLAAGRPEDAERWVARASSFLADLPAVTQPAIDHGRGLLLLATGSWGRARGLLEAAVSGWDARSRIWESSWARLDLAGCLLRSNRPWDAAAILATVRETATRLDSTPLLARAGELSIVARKHGSFDEPWRPLTSREFEVARCIAAGMTNGEIADELAIAPKTASAHVEHILAKLGASRRAEIAAWVSAMGQPVG